MTIETYMNSFSEVAGRVFPRYPTAARPTLRDLFVVIQHRDLNNETELFGKASIKTKLVDVQIYQPWLPNTAESPNAAPLWFFLAKLTDMHKYITEDISGSKVIEVDTETEGQVFEDPESNSNVAITRLRVWVERP